MEWGLCAGHPRSTQEHRKALPLSTPEFKEEIIMNWSLKHLGGTQSLSVFFLYPTLLQIISLCQSLRGHWWQATGERVRRISVLRILRPHSHCRQPGSVIAPCTHTWHTFDISRSLLLFLPTRYGSCILPLHGLVWPLVRGCANPWALKAVKSHGLLSPV